MPKKETVREPRKGIRDIWWNAYMVKGAQFAPFSDIPVCPTTAKGPPSMIITYSEAVKIYHQELRKGNKDFLHMAFVSFYEDDDYDSSCGIWFRNGMDYNTAGSRTVKRVDFVTKTYDAHSIPQHGTPNSVSENYRDGNLLSERYYDADGNAYLDIDYSNHSNPKTHPIVPHEHDIWFDENGTMHRAKEVGIR